VSKAMTINEIAKTIKGTVICGTGKANSEIEYAFASDLMSDVLKIDREKVVLITGLANLQAVRTSEMADIGCIVFARAKKVGDEIISLAKENDIVLIESPSSVFRISGELYRAGVKPIF